MGFLDGVIESGKKIIRAKQVQYNADRAFEAQVAARARAAADRVYESESIKQAERVQKARLVEKANEKIKGFQVGPSMPSMMGNMGGGLPRLPPVFGAQRSEPQRRATSKRREKRPEPPRYKVYIRDERQRKRGGDVPPFNTLPGF